MTYKQAIYAFWLRSLEPYRDQTVPLPLYFPTVSLEMHLTIFFHFLRIYRSCLIADLSSE